MKTNKYQKRFYRGWVNVQDLHLTQIIKKETDLQILTNKKINKDFLEERIRLYRWDIENYINKEPRFLTSLKPLAVELNAPLIIRAMTEAAGKANVGPMSAVAGAIAQFLGKDLLKKGFQDVIIENGGDIFLKTSRTRLLGIYAGRRKLWNKLKIKISPKDTPIGICASSGNIGHSLSFGIADCVVILAKDATLADAVATATCNRVNSRADLQHALDFARAIQGIIGAIIILKNSFISWGRIEFVK